LKNLQDRISRDNIHSLRLSLVGFLDKVVVSSHGGDIGGAALRLFAGGEAWGLLGSLPDNRFLGVRWLSGGEVLHGTGSRSLGGSFVSGFLASLSSNNFGSGGDLDSCSTSLTKRDGLGGSLLEVPVVTGGGNDTLVYGSLVAVERGKRRVGLGGGRLSLAESEVLDGGLELIISEQVGRVAVAGRWVAEARAEVLDDKPDLEAGIRGPDLVGVDASHLEVPFLDLDDFTGEVLDGNVGATSTERSNSLSGEVCGDKEVPVGDKEVGGRLLDLDLDLLASDGLGETLGVTAGFDHLGEQLLEC